MGREDTTECSGLKARILQALKNEIATGEPGSRLAALKLIECAIRDRDVCARGRGDSEGCADADVRSVLETMIAQREASARAHDDEGRFEDALRERDEIAIIKQFLPSPLSGAALDSAVNAVVTDLGASKLADLGRCVSALKARYPGLIESASAGKAVRTALTRR